MKSALRDGSDMTLTLPMIFMALANISLLKYIQVKSLKNVSNHEG